MYFRKLIKLISYIYRGFKSFINRLGSKIRYQKYKYLGSILGKGVILGPGVTLGGKIKIDEYTTIVGSTSIQGEVDIGKNVIIAAHCTILGISHDYLLCNALPYGTDYIVRKIVIEDNVWIGMNVCIGPGIRIGEGAVVGMGAVVTHDVPTCAVVAGNPARIIKNRDVDRYNRLVTENKYLNVIRRKAPHSRREFRLNEPQFKQSIVTRGFMMNQEITTTDKDWQSSILYELAMKYKVLFGNAEKFLIAIRPDALNNIEKCCIEISKVIRELNLNNNVDLNLLRLDLVELIESHNNLEKRTNRSDL